MRLFFHGSKTEEDGRVRIDEFALLRIEVVALSQERPKCLEIAGFLKTKDSIRQRFGNI